MILRLFRGRVAATDRDTYLRFVREHAIARALALPGLLSFQPGIRAVDDGLEIVLVSTWEDFASIASLDRDLDTPVALPGGAEFIRDGASTHYELVAGSLRSMPLDGARVRILHGTLRPNREAAFFEWMRDQRERFLADGLLVGAHLGRRMHGSDAEVAFVGTWRDAATVDALTGGEIDRPVALGEETLTFFGRGPEIETYEAITIAPGTASAPALLIVDDERRCLYATPAAARLTGRSVAALTSLRVDDLMSPSLAEPLETTWSNLVAAGSGSGRLMLVGPKGSERSIHYSARTDVPWPRSHVLLLSARGDVPPAGLDRALVEAGFVARHLVPAAADAGPARSVSAPAPVP